MEATGYCDQCRKEVEVEELHFLGFNCTVYFKCGHHIHYIFAFKSTREHHELDADKPSFEASTLPIALIPHP